MTRHFARPGRESDKLDIELLADGESLTAPKPRRSAGRIARLYWLQSLGFVGFLVVVFLFAATGHVGN